MILIEAILSGIIVGAVYALIGVGLSMIYGVMKVVNFAHGDLLVFSSFTAWFLYRRMAMDPLVSLFIILPVSFLLGILLYYLVIKRLQNSNDSETASFLAFFGISLMLKHLTTSMFGATPRGIPFPYEQFFRISTRMGPFTLSTSRIIAFMVVCVVTVILVYYLQRTRVGKAIRAVIQHKEAAQILGIKTDLISAISLGIGLMSVSIAGVLVTLVFPSISSKLAVNYTTIAFVVIILGGLRQPLGALLGGVVYGITESVAMLLLPMGYAHALTFFIMISVVMWRPEGLLSGVKVWRKKKLTVNELVVTEGY
ncbi:MAG: branched-chain amino acid ABC transporter permease [Dethiobacter sp.]|nr:branched-chain amino acid ABC transporter permease [Dethiobacter sp.]